MYGSGLSAVELERARRAVRRYVSRQVERLAASPYASQVAGVKVSVARSGGVTHAANAWCSTPGSWTSSNLVPNATVVLERVPDEPLCGSCGDGVLSQGLSVLAASNRASVQARALALKAALLWVDLEERVVRAERKPKESAASLERKRAEAERALAAVKGAVAYQFPGAPAALLEPFEGLAARVEAVLGSVADATAGDVHKARVVRWVRRDLLPSQLRGVDPDTFALDESPTLVGLAPYFPAGYNQKLRALVEAFQVRGDADGTYVLVVPRFVFDYMQRTSLGKLTSGVLLLGVPAPASEVVLETAAGLWDPISTGSMVSLADAVSAAGVLLG